MSTRSRSKDLLADQRGSIYVEFLVLIPFLVLIWTFMHFTWQFSTASVQNQRGIRECAWFDAWDACDGSPPPHCRGRDVDGNAVRMTGPFEVGDGELAGTAPGFREVGEELPFLSASLDRLHGDARTYTRNTSRQRPSILGGRVTITGGYKTMCNTMDDEVGELPEWLPNLLREWELHPVVQQACQKLSGEWCP